MAAYVVTAFGWPDPPALRMVHRFENRDQAQRWIERAKAPGKHVIVQATNPLIQYANELNVWIPDPQIRASVMCVHWSVETLSPISPTSPATPPDQLALFLDAPARATTTDPRSREASHSSASTTTQAEEAAHEVSRGTRTTEERASVHENTKAVGAQSRRPSEETTNCQPMASYSNTERAGNP